MNMESALREVLLECNRMFHNWSISIHTATDGTVCFTLGCDTLPNEFNFATLFRAFEPLTECKWSNVFNEQTLCIQGTFHGQKASLCVRMTFLTKDDD